MKTSSLRWLAAVIVLACTATAPRLSVAEEDLLGAAPAPAAPPASAEWYYRPAPEGSKEPTVAQQRAMRKADARAARLDAMRWYGFSGSRPTATAIAFTSMYSPQWQMPGGRPFAWFPGSRPVIVYSRPYTLYR